MSEYVRHDNLTVQQGDDRAFTWPLLDADGNPLGTSDYSAEAWVQPFYRSGGVLHSWTTENGRAQLGPGSVTLLMNDSEQWAWSSGCYFLRITDGDGKSEYIARGSIVVIPGSFDG